MQKLEPVVVNYLGERVLEDVRTGRPIASDFAKAIYRYPLIDGIRAHVVEADGSAVLAFARSSKDDIAVWSFAVGGLMRALRSDLSVRAYLEEAWSTFEGFERRYHLLFRLLDYSDLQPALRDEIWRFVQENLSAFIFDRTDWYGGPSGVLDSVSRRLADASFPKEKQWIYLVSVLASNDRPAATALLKRYASSAHDFTGMVARFLLERSHQVWPPVPS